MRCLFVMALALLLPACASVPMATAYVDAVGKRFMPPPPGQGALYVYREGVLGAAVKMSVWEGHRTLGTLAHDTWLRVDLDPGQYVIRCTGGENGDSAVVQLGPGEIRFVDLTWRFGLMVPRCGALETNADKGRPAVLAGRRAYAPVVTPEVATPDGPISIVYRDDTTNERTLNGVAHYGAVLGRDRSVSFTVKNLDSEPVCDGTFMEEGPTGGKFSMTCFRGLFSANGNYERKTGEPYFLFTAHGQTSRGFPITLVVGRHS